MNVQINAGKALQFLLNNEYQKFLAAYKIQQEQVKEEDRKDPPTFDQWLTIIGIAKEKSNIIKPTGLFGK